MILSRGSDDPHQDAPPAKVVVCSAEMDGKNKLSFGDNLNILRDHVADSSVDLIYLDPPFNSNANYNVLFKEKSGEESMAVGPRRVQGGSGPPALALTACLFLC
jgi:hypothetical protein